MKFKAHGGHWLMHLGNPLAIMSVASNASAK
jgi:hypothetical protein